MILKLAQLSDTSIDLGHLLVQQCIDRLTASECCLSRSQQNADLPPAHIKTSAEANEAQLLNMSRRIDAVVAIGALRHRQQLFSFIITDRFNLDASGSCKLTDLHQFSLSPD
jgi:hypothetical protein